ncbi:MAG: LysR family transcriptional regulator [Cryobacterium sp.]|uniref:LysR family transcriptional regulator n=1 Tax=unclassified Cryobacterium TaxID=2649013 RepID=UPI0018CAEC29|nr:MULTISPECIES: LysR family transcriptional regulator [unclassified Cryobacterium]MCY7405291.1 LysR family transcriptional regulator [Cryobacterium sp.]MEC5153016.1 DNA-binding transcriptional LysR family regulator [Cryobacterium sp. CAN_C3]
MDTTLLRQFIAAAEEPDFARAASRLGVDRTVLGASIKKLEAQVGFALFDRDAQATTLTDAGVALLTDARRAVSAAPGQTQNTGGKAKASKGRGRAPAVKGQPRQGKKRQSR